MNFFTKLPWVQFIFSEKTIMAVREIYRSDGAKRYHEVDGGLNKVGIRSFRDIIKKIGLNINYIELRAVKRLQFLTKIPILNEYFTWLIIGVLVK